MNKEKLLQQLANLTVKVGVNIQEGQLLIVKAGIESAPLVREIVKEAYLAKAKKVIVLWSDGEVDKCFYQYASEEELQNYPDYLVSRAEYIVSEKAAAISITSPNPDLFADVDPRKIQMHSKAASQKLEFYQKFQMASEAPWCVIAYPNDAWAHKVFPDLPQEEAYEKLLEAILLSSRVVENEDATTNWHEHMEKLKAHNDLLNSHDFSYLQFKNSLGTDLKVGLVDGHIWSGGGEYSQSGIYFAPNIPTEETFTMPHKEKVEGKVVATKPLLYQGQLIEDFYLVFKEGKVISYGAKKGEETLKSLIEYDEGSSRLGEVALISHNSPISNLNILFYNTLFDENASCHLALGNAYTMNIKDGNNLPLDELLAKGYNKSQVHVDFMFGSEDMEIIGVKKGGTKVQIFNKGNFVI